MVIAVTPKVLSGVVVLQSPPEAVLFSPRSNVRLPEMWSPEKTFAVEETLPYMWTFVTCPEVDVITNRTVAADLPMSRGAVHVSVPDPPLVTLIAFWQLIAEEDRNVSEIRAALT